jgi:hypothetical protein
MSSSERVEHFVTLFDSHYLPQGLCLHHSLGIQGEPFHLWILAIDDACAEALEILSLECVTVLRLTEIETERLLSVKNKRSIGEYCWTLTPFLPSHVFVRAPRLDRVTYIDADLYFFDKPNLLLEEFSQSGKHVLLTEHAFGPEYADKIRYGRFCVQFMTFRNTEESRRMLQWWQDRCIEWCFSKEEEGKFGDQKYLDVWPTLFQKEVHILTQTERTLAPWNVAHFERTTGRVHPVFYHFHSLKIVAPNRVVLYFMYAIGRRNQWIYDRYLGALRIAVNSLRLKKIPIVARPLSVERIGWLSLLIKWLAGEVNWASL